MADSFYAVNAASIEGTTIEHKVGPYRARVQPRAAFVVFTLHGEEALFTGTSSVTDIDERSEDDRLVQTITIEPIERFSEARDLSAIAGSLEKVYRFLEPERHFKWRDIIRLSEHDFKTISENSVAVHRSVFRFLFCSLPLDVQSDFVRRFIGEFPLDNDGNIRSYVGLAQLIVRFYRLHVRSPLVLVQRFASVHQKFSMGIERVALRRRTPSLSSLRLRRGEGGEDIRFGATAERVSELMANNRLFAMNDTQPALLEEAEAQLRQAPPEEHIWSDPIF